MLLKRVSDKMSPYIPTIRPKYMAKERELFPVGHICKYCL